MELVPPTKRQGLPIRQYEVSKPQLYKGIRVLPSDTPCVRVPRNNFNVSYKRTEMTDEEIIEVLTAEETLDPKTLEAPYAPFFGEYSDEEFTKEIRSALKVKQQIDVEEGVRKEEEERRRMAEAIAEYEEKRKVLLMSMALSDEEEFSEDEEEESHSDTEDEAEDQDSDPETESEAETEAKFEILEPEEQDESKLKTCKRTVVFDGFFEVVCEEEVATSE